MNPGILTSGYAPPPMPYGLLGRPTPMPIVNAYGYDADASRYIRAVELADGQPLELGVCIALNAFVVGCKSAGVWESLLDCCILCGARTLAGALVPLKGRTPTNVNFVSGDYARSGQQLGLVGNGSTKYLSANRRPNELPLSNAHLSVFVSNIGTVGVIGQYIGTSSFALLHVTNLKIRARINTNNNDSVNDLRRIGLIGASRDQYLVSHTARGGSVSETITASQFGNPNLIDITVLARNAGPANFTMDIYSNGRVAFYSIGTGVHLMALDFLTTRLMSDIRAALP